MNPIFNEYIQFLEDKTNDFLANQLEEGKFWLDKQIVKCFDKAGKEHKIFRIFIDDDLNVSLGIPKTGYDKIEDIDIATWNDLVVMNKEHLVQIEKDSLNLIREKLAKFNDYIPLVPISMGKDSMVTAHLIRTVEPNTEAIFNNTTLDCADTYIMAKKYPNCRIMNPKEGFYNFVKKYNIVFNRLARGCCRIFKVGEMVNQLDHNTKYLMFMGMRNEESNTRSGYQDEWINTAEWGDTKWQGILPIRKWTEMDIWLYILWRKLDFNQKYRKGYSRVGCSVACPYYTKSTWVLDKYFYPTMRKRWEDILREDFIFNKKWIVMNCTIDEYVNKAWNGGTFRSEPIQEVIGEFAEYNNLGYQMAEKYFSKTCCECGKKIKSKDVLAMNMKLHGRETKQYLCKKHFKELHEMSEGDWQKNIESFKAQGCQLF